MSDTANREYTQGGFQGIGPNMPKSDIGKGLPIPRIFDSQAYREFDE